MASYSTPGAAVSDMSYLGAYVYSETSSQKTITLSTPTLLNTISLNAGVWFITGCIRIANNPSTTDTTNIAIGYICDYARQTGVITNNNALTGDPYSSGYNACKQCLASKYVSNYQPNDITMNMSGVYTLDATTTIVLGVQLVNQTTIQTSKLHAVRIG